MYEVCEQFMILRHEKQLDLRSEISGSHVRGYEDYSLQGYSAV
jgi:hypothetical protein